MRTTIKRIIILLIIWGIIFFINKRIQASDHILCSAEVDEKFNQLLESKNTAWNLTLWDLPISFPQIWNFNLWNFNLSNIKISDIEVEHTSTTYEEMHYSGIKRYYDMMLWFKVKGIELSLPVQCSVQNSVAELEIKMPEK